MMFLAVIDTNALVSAFSLYEKPSLHKMRLNKKIPTTIYDRGLDFFVGTTARMFVKFKETRLPSQIKLAVQGVPPDIF